MEKHIYIYPNQYFICHCVCSFLAVYFLCQGEPGIESIKQYNIIVAAIGKMRQYNASMEGIKSFLEEENFYEVPITEYMQERIAQ